MYCCVAAKLVTFVVCLLIIHLVPHHVLLYALCNPAPLSHVLRGPNLIASLSIGVGSGHRSDFTTGMACRFGYC